ncbi:MAG TPA: DUF6090 family protein [Mucilaginibacter sp.]|nr:DUF6090 family protein [Mucilaginibacter sp.]
MEHEIMGHTKKALKVAKDREKGFNEKFKEILIEVVIIIFAVSFAAFIERTREHFKEQAEAKEFLLGLNSDIANEIKQVEDSKRQMVKLDEDYKKLLHFNKNTIDSIEKVKARESFNIPKFNTRPLNGRYEGFKSSGKIQTIENDSLRNNILKLYQEAIPFIDFSETAFNSNQARIEDILFSGQGSNATEDNVLRVITTPRGKLALTFSISYSDGVIAGYDRMIAQAKKVQKEIKREYAE